MELSNIPQIDKEHRAIHEAFVALRAKEGTQYDKDELQKEIDALLLNLEAHFHTEEVIMKKVAYFDYEGHVKTHIDLVFLIKTLYNTVPRNPDRIFHIIGVIHEWVTNHIDIESSLFRKMIANDPGYNQFK